MLLKQNMAWRQVSAGKDSQPVQKWNQWTFIPSMCINVSFLWLPGICIHYTLKTHKQRQTHIQSHTHTLYPTTCNKQKGQLEIFSKTGMRWLSQPTMRFNGSSTSPSNKNCWERILLTLCGLSPPVGLAMNKFKHSNLDDLEPFDQQWKHIETWMCTTKKHITPTGLPVWSWDLSS